MDSNLLDRVCKYLFNDMDGLQDATNLFKSLYYCQSHGSYKQPASDFINQAIESIPKYARESLPFSYAMTNRLFPKFVDIIESSSNTEESKEHAQKAVQKALDETMQQFGMSTDINGQKHQEEMSEQCLESGIEQIGGLLATGNPDVVQVAQKIRYIDAGMKNLQKTLKNVSAISESLVKGVEKVKSDYSEFGYSYGRDLTKIDPSELSNLQGYRELFMLKYAKGELLEESPIDKKGLGDLFIAIDTSGSTDTRAMGDYKVIDLEMGIGLGIARLAAKNKCKVRLALHHTSLYQDSGWIKGKSAISQYFVDLFSKEIIDFGDNNFEQVLTTIAEKLDCGYATKRKPGIIFITDGHDRIRQPTQDLIAELKLKTGIKLFTYFVAKSDPRRHAKDTIAVSDSCYWIDATKPIDGQIENFEFLG